MKWSRRRAATKDCFISLTRWVFVSRKLKRNVKTSRESNVMMWNMLFCASTSPKGKDILICKIRRCSTLSHWPDEAGTSQPHPLCSAVHYWSSLSGLVGWAGWNHFIKICSFEWKRNHNLNTQMMFDVWYNTPASSIFDSMNKIWDSLQYILFFHIFMFYICYTVKNTKTFVSWTKQLGLLLEILFVMPFCLLTCLLPPSLLNYTNEQTANWELANCAGVSFK